MKNILLRISLIIALLAGSKINASAQFDTVYLGVNGLTCSQCSRSVEMQIRKLEFVADVQMSLERTEGKIILKKNRKPDIDKIAQAVFDAGFSVRYLQADFNIDHSVIQTGTCLRYLGDQYVFTKAPKQPLTGTVKLKFIGKKFLPKNEYKKMEPYMENKCGEAEGKVYHISI
jgi:copper chaperone CopZ